MTVTICDAAPPAVKVVPQYIINKMLTGAGWQQCTVKGASDNHNLSANQSVNTCVYITSQPSSQQHSPHGVCD